MSVKRYVCFYDTFMEAESQEDVNGEWVKYEDYADLLAATQWRPIETAPKDGTHVLAFHNGPIWTVWWSDTQMWHDSNDYDYRPTHWMPLPNPPSV